MSDRASMIAKVKALLAKTEDAGCTEHEALAALAAAERLMAAYDVTEDDLIDQRRDGVEIYTGDPAEDLDEIRFDLVHAIGVFTSTKGWRRYAGLSAPTGRRKKGKPQYRFMFCGPRSDCEFADWLLANLSKFVEHQIYRYILTRVLPHTMPKAELRDFMRAETAGFARGCTTRIGERLKALAPKPMTTNANALMVITEQQIADAMSAAGIHLSSGKGIARRTDGTAQAAGRAAGDKASFARPIGGSTGGTQLRIGNK